VTLAAGAKLDSYEVLAPIGSGGMGEAYVLWKTLAASCRQARLGDEPRQVFEELSELTMVDVVLPTRNGVEIRKRCISQPTERQRILLERLGMRLPTALERTQM
jgi:hypothetical protein